MRNIFLVALREYAENARTKGFWIGLLMFPLILFLSFQVPLLLHAKGAPIRHFVLADLSGRFEPAITNALHLHFQKQVLEALNAYARAHLSAEAAAQTSAPPRIWRQFPNSDPETVERFVQDGGAARYLRELQPALRADAPAFTEPRRILVRVPVPEPGGGDLASLTESLRPYLRGDKRIPAQDGEVKLNAAIIIPPGIDQHIVRPGTPPTDGGVQFWTASLPDETLRRIVENAINQQIRQRESQARGLDLAAFAQIEATRLPLVVLNPKKEAGHEKVSTAEVIAHWAPIAFVYLLWIALFSISQMLLNNTIEEKSNRIIEVLLSSVTPREYVFGKLAGIAGVGCTMLGVWLLAMFGIGLWQAGGNPVAQEFLTLVTGSRLLPAFLVYFILGYILYAALILSIGSVCNTIKESQNYMALVTMLMVVPLLTMTFIPRDPNGTVATVLSWIPLYTPFIMMNRAAADPPLFDLVGTMILLILTTAVVLWAAVKIFRTAILRTGQPPRLLEMFRWLRDREN